MKIGFIGQGWIGKSYADDFENRGHEVIRYSLEEPHIQNKDRIPECEIVFIAVPTPTTQEGFDSRYVRDALTNVGEGKTAVIKSTILPGTTCDLQKRFPNIYLMHSPEFLREKTCKEDAANPDRNIVGIPYESPEYVERAHEVLAVLPRAPYETIMPATEAELVKYGGNCYLYMRVLFMNMLYDFVKAKGGNWDAVREGLIHDPRIGKSHTEPVNAGGRGAGGHCFIKDFEAFRQMYTESVDDQIGKDFLKNAVYKNIQLLADSGKNIDLLEGVYGKLNNYRVWKNVHDTML